LRSRCCRGSGTSSLTLSISGVEILNAKALLAADPKPITISVPSRARSTTTAVAADLGVLFGTADSLGVGDLPLLYVTRWAGKRLRSDPSSVARALRSLKREGSIRRGPDVVSPTGRASYTYRRAA
jgi:hypothetical protein